nr:hypothetical protein [Pseudobutyrivibrio sp.]
MLKKKIIASVLSTAFVFTACTNAQANDKSNQTAAEVQENANQTTEEAKTQENVDDTSTKPLGDDTGLYTAFLNNEVEATVDYEEEYNNGNSYNLEALTKEYFPDDEVDISNVKDADSIKDDNNEDGEKLGITYKYIDCGVDGKSELLLTISPSYIVYKFVIQEKEGKLFIKYTDNTDDRGWSNISDKGYY